MRSPSIFFRRKEIFVLSSRLLREDQGLNAGTRAQVSSGHTQSSKHRHSTAGESRLRQLLWYVPRRRGNGGKEDLSSDRTRIFELRGSVSRFKSYSCGHEPRLERGARGLRRREDGCICLHRGKELRYDGVL